MRFNAYRRPQSHRRVVDCFKLPDGTVRRIQFLIASAGGLAHESCKVPIFLQPFDRSGKLTRVAGTEEQSGDLIIDKFNERTEPRRDNRQSDRICLDKSRWELLIP